MSARGIETRLKVTLSVHFEKALPLIIGKGLSCSFVRYFKYKHSHLINTYCITRC